MSVPWGCGMVGELFPTFVLGRVVGVFLAVADGTGATFASLVTFTSWLKKFVREASAGSVDCAVAAVGTELVVGARRPPTAAGAGPEERLEVVEVFGERRDPISALLFPVAALVFVEGVVALVFANIGVDCIIRGLIVEEDVFVVAGGGVGVKSEGCVLFSDERDANDPCGGC